MIFTHTYLERGSWRGWFADGQTLEIAWSRRGGNHFGLGVKLHSEGNDYARRFLWIGLIFVQFYIPLGLVREEYPAMDEPSWDFSLSREFGILLHWGMWRKHWEWPFHRINLDWEFLGKDGKWRSKFKRSFENFSEEMEREDTLKKTETYPYTYVLKSGMVQNRKATISKKRWTKGRHILSRIGLWPSRIEYCIDVQFSDEVGERSGSWKGGCLGCGYDMLPGEEPLDTLRRMEKEREF